MDLLSLYSLIRRWNVNYIFFYECCESVKIVYLLGYFLYCIPEMDRTQSADWATPQRSDSNGMQQSRQGYTSPAQPRMEKQKQLVLAPRIIECRFLTWKIAYWCSMQRISKTIVMMTTLINIVCEFVRTYGKTLPKEIKFKKPSQKTFLTNKLILIIVLTLNEGFPWYC